MIEVSHLVKQFGDLRAVDDVSFSVQPGEIVGFLGPNGAGKSTTMKMLTGFLAPTSGSVSVLGHRMEEDPVAAQAQIGYLPEGAPCYEEMTPAGFLDFIARIRGFADDDARRARIREVITTLSLEGVLHQRIETLSKGFKRRVGLAQAILHDPAVLILDEPTDGLDPNQKHQVRELIRGLSRDKIVIVSTHILEEVAAVCTRAMIVANGRVIADETPATLEARSRYYQAVVVEAASLEEVAKVEATLAEFGETETDDRVVTLLAPGDRHLRAVIDKLDDAGVEPVSIYQDRGRLDDVFRDITGGVA